jgi:hypothetical protein
MINLIKYWLWLRYTPTIYEQTEGFTDDEIHTCGEIQRMIKKNTGKYYTVIECYDLYKIAGDRWVNIKEYIR